MVLYLGNSEKLKLNINNITHSIIIKPRTNIIAEVLLSSSDEYLLQDVSGVYLSPKEEM